MSSLSQTIFNLFIADEKKAVLPDVTSYLTSLSTDGLSITNLPQASKALMAVEADGVSGFNQFVKDSATLLLAHITAPSTTAAPPAPAAKT